VLDVLDSEGGWMAAQMALALHNI